MAEVSAKTRFEEVAFRFGKRSAGAFKGVDSGFDEELWEKSIKGMFRALLYRG
jgi:hypothetical protein